MLVFEILIFELCQDKDRILITVKGMLFCKLQKEKKKHDRQEHTKDMQLFTV